MPEASILVHTSVTSPAACDHVNVGTDGCCDDHGPGSARVEYCLDCGVDL